MGEPSQSLHNFWAPTAGRGVFWSTHIVVHLRNVQGLAYLLAQAPKVDGRNACGVKSQFFFTALGQCVQWALTTPP